MHKKIKGQVCLHSSPRQAGFSTPGRGGAWPETSAQTIVLKENPPVFQQIYVKEVLKGIFQLLLLNAKIHWAEIIHPPDCIWEQNWSVISDLAFAYDPHIRAMGQGKKNQMNNIFQNQFLCQESCSRMMP